MKSLNWSGRASAITGTELDIDGGSIREVQLSPSNMGIRERKDAMAQRTWFITGVNSGFGRLMTEKLLERGDRVAGSVRKMDSMNDLKTKYGDRLWLAHLDMTDLPEIRNVVEKAFAEFGKIDVIVCNAGYGLFGAAEELSDEQVAHQLRSEELTSE